MPQLSDIEVLLAALEQIRASNPRGSEARMADAAIRDQHRREIARVVNPPSWAGRV